MPAPTTIRLVHPDDPQGDPPPQSLQEGADSSVSYENGALRIVHGDGSSTIDFDPQGDDAPAKPGSDDDFYRNIADDIDERELADLADDLLTGIEYDEQSRRDWLDMRARGMTLLGLKLGEPRGDVGTSSAPLEGMSTIRHPLLLDATIRFQATARGELLPAAGPVKVRNDAPTAPEGVSMPAEQLDELGDALETDMNHYLTVTATEYVPDTDRMLFYVGFGGDGFKKVYNCPLRRRPVSESVDAEDIIVSNATTDIRNCGRVTHKIKMRPSILKRMQIIGAYRDIDLSPPADTESPNPVEQEKANIAGIRVRPRVEDADHVLFECYCEADIKKFAPKQFSGKGLPLPYVVTLEKESRKVLAVRRNWSDDDEECLSKQVFVQFPFIRGLGFYGLGLIHILGNVTLTLTAAWREMIDSGMFANFPGTVHAKGAGRQLTNQLRVPPGGSIGLEVPPGMRIQDAIMALPYKEPGPAFTAFIAHVEEVGQRLGQTAEVNVGEGKQETPVGTTMALIEQATKVMDSVHKRMHAAQAEEFALLKERFREDPEAFWRHNKKPARQWTIEQFRAALEERELVPVADPNNPTSLHRIAKSVALLTLAQQYSQFFNPGAVLKRVLRIVGIDAEGLLNTTPTPPPPDPRMEAIKAKAQAEERMAQIQQFQATLKAQQMQIDVGNKQADRASREKIEQMQIALEQLRLQQEAVIHAHDIQRDNMKAHSDIQNDRAQTVQQLGQNHAEHQQSLQHEQEKHQHSMHVERSSAQNEVQTDQVRRQNELAAQQSKHEQAMRHAEDKHAAGLQQTKEKHEADLTQKRALAKIKPKPTTGGK